MGYLTLHAIRIVNKYNTRKNLKKLLKLIHIISGYSFNIKGSTIVSFPNTDDYCYKWYECLSDMEKVSKLLPKLKINICGKGEEEDDEWSYIFKNGKRYDSSEMFIKNKYDSDFNEGTESNHCSIISLSSSESENDYEEDED